MKKKLHSLFIALTLISFSKAQVLLTESFEGTFPPAGWSLINNGSGNSWTQNTNSVYSSDGTNSMVYLYNSTNPADAWAFTPPITLTSGQIVRITFDQSVRDNIYAEALKVTVGLAQTVGSQTTILYDDNNLTNMVYATRMATFTAPSSGDYYFAFNCYSQTDQWRLFVDNIKIETPLPYNSGVISIVEPDNCYLSATSPISVDITNFGSSSISGFNLVYSVNGGANITETFTGTIAPGDTANFSFAATANLSGAGPFYITSYTLLSGDTDQANDTTSKTVIHMAGVPEQSSTTDFPIPDDDPVGISSGIRFCGLPSALNSTFKIKYLKIDDLTHPYDSDLNIYLVSPTNVSLAVMLGNGGTGDDISDATFTDTAVTNIADITSGGIPMGFYHTYDAAGLASFSDGQDPNGEWRLEISDNGLFDEGTLHKWTLAFEDLSGTVVNTIVKSNEMLGIYPNPTNGNFNITYSGEGSQLSVKLMNVAGETIYNDNVTNFNGRYSSTIDMNERAKGIYFIQIVSNDHVSTKKIILN
jgi:subtilisin-like proprotein convertase family protein